MEERPLYAVGDEVPLRPGTLQKFNSGFEQPTPGEVRSLIRILGMTGTEVADFVGVKNSRTIRKWQEVKESDADGQVNRNKNEIPYSAWRLLLLHAKLILEP